MALKILFTSEPNELRTNSLAHNNGVFILRGIAIRKLNPLKVLIIKRTVFIRKITVRSIRAIAPPIYNALNGFNKPTIRVHYIHVAHNYPARVSLVVWLTK